ncbi:GTP-dependent dephospho-CoA kinase family protein [Halegenticoccus tardaugens]|uniref:GTP-dependent dephospho-CoA kinase family protein n=1 Tax=Halegenticoccus tardaugens TaxID=2071624 RepID=UPI00100B8CF7|nr:GTP-dependent dephospho-CoA kinase family protein [Halegenticoccus tardaugens]
MLRLPEDLRGAFKEPLGRVYTDPAILLRAVESASDEHGGCARGPLVCVGDVVTYHLRRADRDPDVAVVDGKTKRREVTAEVRATLEGDNPQIEVENPPATLSSDLLAALRTALDADEPTVILVDGEEDLATLPAIVAAPLGASVVYGQPDEGMVHVPVTEEAKAEARDLLARMEGDSDAALARLDA